MENLTPKEEEIMQHFWARGPMFVRELLELYPQPHPHFNTLSTLVRLIEGKGYLGHRAYGNSFRYQPLCSRNQYRQGRLHEVVSRYYESSYLGVVAALVDEEVLTLDALRALIERIESRKR